MKAWGKCADDHWHDLGSCADMDAADALANTWESSTGGVILKLYVGAREP